MASPPDNQLSAQLLFRAAEVLLSCADSATRIDSLFAPLINQQFAGPEKAVLQEIDLLKQSLADISTCLTQLALAQMRGEPVDEGVILAPLRLNDLRSRLIGKTPIKRDPRGDFSLF
jgi:hypothetical protein